MQIGTIFGAAAGMLLWATPAVAQAPGAALDAALANQTASINAVDAKTSDEIAGLIERLDAEALAQGLVDAVQTEATGDLAARIDALQARVEALEESVVTPPPDPPPAPSTLFPNADDGLPITQLGLRQHVDWAQGSPYKNLARFNPNIGGPARVEAGLADPVTGWVTLGANERLIVGRVRNSQVSGFDLDPGLWCVAAEREGSAFVRIGDFLDAGSTPALARVCGDLTGKTDARQLTLDGGAEGGRIRIKFWGPEKFEGDPEGWHPDFLAAVSGYKILRSMDWTGPIGSKVVRASQWIGDDDYVNYAGSGGWNIIPAANDTLIRAGYSLARLFDLHAKTDTAAHLVIPATLGGQSVRAEITGCDSDANALKLGEETALLRAAVARNMDSIRDDARREFRAFADRVIDAMIATRYPDNRVLIVEPGNELWNTGSPGFACSYHYAAAVSAALIGSTDLGYGQGYITAIAVEAFKARFKERKPGQALVFVMGWQTGAADGVGGFRAQNSIDGFKAYKADHAADLIDVFGGTTGYWAGAYKWNKARSPGAGNPFGVATEADYNAAFEAAHRADPAALRRLMRDWYLSAAAHDNVASVVRNNLTLRDIAIVGGMRGVLEYEGSPHDNALDKAGNLGSVYPASFDAWLDFASSAEGREVQAAMIAALAAIDPISPAVTSGWAPRTLVVSDFHNVGLDRTARQPWLERSADQITACNDNSIGGAWCAVLRPARRAVN